MRTALALSLLFASCGLASQQEKLEAVIADATRRIEARDFEGASAALKPYAGRYPGDVRIWNLVGISEGELGRTASARDAFERGLNVAPDSISLNENLGFLYYRLANYTNAKRYLSKAFALGSTSPGVAFSLAAVKLRTGEQEGGLTDLKRLETDLANFLDYWDERGWAELPKDPLAAEISFSRALVLSPGDLRALNGAASVAESQKLDEKALSFLLRAKQEHPDDVDTLVHFGTVCLRRDLVLDALPALEHAHKADPGNNAALYFFARAQIGVQHWQEAHELFSEFAHRVPTFAPTYYALGWLDSKLNRTDEARRNLEHCISLAPEHADARYELAQIEVDAGHLDAAEKLLSTVLARNPKHAKANVGYGDILMRKGQLAEAQAHYETALQESPEWGPAHYKFSTLLFRLQKNEQAEQERALGARLNAEALKSSKIVFQLASPDGAILNAVR